MKQIYKTTVIMSVVLGAAIFLTAFQNNSSEQKNFIFKMPYKQAGLTTRQAAAHLLDRFSYGATPKQIDEVVKIGLENWFEQQLKGGLNDDDLNNRLKDYDALKLTNNEVLEKFPRPAKILREAVKDGKINRDSVKSQDNKEYHQLLQAYMKEKGYRPQQELFRQFANQKLLRAAYSNNQMHEVLTDFWFNHFNVSVTKNDCAPFIPAYERDVIRPNVTGKFYDILLATAQSPAMLYYLDNFSSSGSNSDMKQQQELQQKRIEQRLAAMDPNSEDAKRLEKQQQNKKNQGLNENYAREVMELHTLGVDGGYTQQDVTQAAKVLTGWTVFPYDIEGAGQQVKNLINRFGENNLEKRGFVHKGDFLFAMNRHDNGEKTVLNKTFPAGGRYDEGLQLLNLLAHHPSTAKFISRKMAIRFVNDDPPQSLIDKMTKTFQQSDGDIKEVLKSMVSAPEFWSKIAIREKTKSPFELAVSTIRVLDADIKAPFVLFQWVTKMGEKYYFYQAPTGFPDKAAYWINTGSLLYRMNFGLAFAAQKIPGVSFDLASLNNNHEPESAEAALAVYSKILMPERNLDPTIKRLTPLINDPDLQKKIDEASGKHPVQNSSLTENDEMMNGQQEEVIYDKQKSKNQDENKVARQMLKKGNKPIGNDMMPTTMGNNTMLSQVVGIILGSPEFQRR